MDIEAVKLQVRQILSAEPPTAVPQSSIPTKTEGAEASVTPVSSPSEVVPTQETPQSQEEQQKLLSDVTAEMNNIISELGISVKFRVHITESGQYVAQLVDISKGKVIKSLPPEEIVNIRERTREAIKGFLINEES